MRQSENRKEKESIYTDNEEEVLVLDNIADA